jgi:hypothetical protein
MLSQELWRNLNLVDGYVFRANIRGILVRVLNCTCFPSPAVTSSTSSLLARIIIRLVLYRYDLKFGNGGGQAGFSD